MALVMQLYGGITCVCNYEAKNGSFQPPRIKITPQSAKKSSDDDKSSAVISKNAPTQQVRVIAANQRCPSLFQHLTNTPSTSNHVGGVCWCLQRPAHHHIDNFLLSSKKLTNSFTSRKPNNMTTNLVLDATMGYSPDNAAKHLDGIAVNRGGQGAQ